MEKGYSLAYTFLAGSLSIALGQGFVRVSWNAFSNIYNNLFLLEINLACFVAGLTFLFYGTAAIIYTMLEVAYAILHLPLWKWLFKLYKTISGHNQRKRILDELKSTLNDGGMPLISSSFTNAFLGIPWWLWRPALVAGGCALMLWHALSDSRTWSLILLRHFGSFGDYLSLLPLMGGIILIGLGIADPSPLTRTKRKPHGHALPDQGKRQEVASPGQLENYTRTYK